jgi:hypothetical protein
MKDDRNTLKVEFVLALDQVLSKSWLGLTTFWTSTQ